MERVCNALQLLSLCYNSKRLNRRGPDIQNGLLERDMKKVDVVSVNDLLSDFCKRAALARDADAEEVRASVMEIIADVEQDVQIRGALNN